MLDLCTTGSENGLGSWTCVQQVQRVDNDAGLVCNRFREWIRMLNLCTTGSGSGQEILDLYAAGSESG